jgi:ATP-dependent exoDNAse (exonuclease V) beta subunit
MNRRLVIAALLLAPSIAAAQRGGGTRTQADQKTQLFDKEEPKGPTLRARDVEDQSPLKLLIDKRKDLKLTDQQLAQLKEDEPRLKEKNASLLKSVDSLVHEMRSSSATPTDQERSRIASARTALMEVLGNVNANYDASAKEALDRLDPEQQAKAKDLIEKQRRDSEKLFRERLNPGDGGQHP